MKEEEEEEEEEVITFADLSNRYFQTINIILDSHNRELKKYSKLKKAIGIVFDESDETSDDDSEINQEIKADGKLLSEKISTYLDALNVQQNHLDNYLTNLPDNTVITNGELEAEIKQSSQRLIELLRQQVKEEE